ncbi:MAG: hypothetical protein AB1626_01105 [Candidatus Micrarchaeota archaeon]
MAEKKRFAAQDEEGGSGSVEITEDDVVLRLRGKPIAVKKSYVAGIDKAADLPLGKASVVLTYYDLFGNKESASLAMVESDYRALKKILGK